MFRAAHLATRALAVCWGVVGQIGPNPKPKRGGGPLEGLSHRRLLKIVENQEAKSTHRHMGVYENRGPPR